MVLGSGPRAWTEASAIALVGQYSFSLNIFGLPRPDAAKSIFRIRPCTLLKPSYWS